MFGLVTQPTADMAPQSRKRTPCTPIAPALDPGSGIGHVSSEALIARRTGPARRANRAPHGAAETTAAQAFVTRRRPR